MYTLFSLSLSVCVCVCVLDVSLHEIAVREGMLTIVLEIFKSRLPSQNQPQPGKKEKETGAIVGGATGEGVREEEEVVDCWGFVKACTQCLQLLVLTSCDIRSQLRNDTDLLLGLFQGQLHTHTHTNSHIHIHTQP